MNTPLSADDRLVEPAPRSPQSMGESPLEAAREDQAPLNDRQPRCGAVRWGGVGWGAGGESVRLKAGLVSDALACAAWVGRSRRPVHDRTEPVKLLGDTLVVLLCGGNKATQPRDIARAQATGKDLKE